ncbi:MAG TPA: methyltransferase domain-containing protein [Actinomycetes bacterium]|nr:methyltransferase domain-containing protein [Actinomycetes bacterium]
MPAPITAQQIREYVNTFEWFREPAKQGYLEAAIDRLTHTLNVIPRLPDPERVRVLEIGGIPYFMTVLIQKYFGYQVECANEPTWKTDREENVEILVNDHGERHEIRWKALNIEFDDWPWEDDRFDLVVYCEVIEHLTYDPTQTLAEAHRVLRTGTGQLLLSTPNALAWQYLVEAVQGRNPFPPYSGYNLYARHHRLFSCAELEALCRQVGYDVELNYSTRDLAYEHPRRLDRLASLLARAGRLRARQDVIYLLATAKGPRRYAYPDSRPMEIYTDVHAYDRVVRGVLRMADNESTHLRGGFFPLEPWGGGIRWTGPEARAVLKYAGERKAAVAFNTGTARRGPSVRGSVTVGDENGARSARQEFEVPSDSWQTVVAPVPEGLRDRVWVTITVDNPMVPGELDRGVPDGRTLGVAVREIALT